MKIASVECIIHGSDFSESDQLSLKQRGYDPVPEKNGSKNRMYVRKVSFTDSEGGAGSTAVDGIMRQIEELKRHSTELMVYVPKEEDLIYMQDGSGEQLIQDDLDAGFNDYIDYKINHYSGMDALFAEGDGGIYMYTNEGVLHWTAWIDACLEYIYGKSVDYILLPIS